MFHKKPILRVGYVIVVTALLISACAPASAPTVSGAAVKIESPAVSAQVNDTLKVAVNVERVSNLIAFEAHLSFDPNVLEVVEIMDGDFIQADFTVQNAFDNSAGTIDYAIAQINREPADGGGMLFEIVFRAKAAGSSPIRFRAMEAAPAGMLLSDPNGVALQVSLTDGSITVK